MTRDEAQELVMDYGLHLKDLPDEFKKDELIVLQAIQLDPKQIEMLDLDFEHKTREAFFYADDSLKNNREFVLKAVGVNGSSIEYANEEFKKDKEIALKAVSSREYRFSYCLIDESLQNDREIVEAAVKNDGAVWRHLPDNFKKDKEILLLAIDDIGSDFEDVDESLRNDPDVQKAFDRRYTDENWGS